MLTIPLETFLVLAFLAFAMPGICACWVLRGVYKGWQVRQQMRAANRAYCSKWGF